ncbi:hypothetical protein CHARACLAT_033358, partial [Characodon lateralis]|nr:hypothetical protein [Characodon lateralis]
SCYSLIQTDPSRTRDQGRNHHLGSRVGPPESHQKKVVRAKVDRSISGHREDNPCSQAEGQRRYLVSLEPVCRSRTTSTISFSGPGGSERKHRRRQSHFSPPRRGRIIPG